VTYTKSGHDPTLHHTDAPPSCPPAPHPSLLAAIRQTWTRGTLALPASLRPQQFINLLNRLGHPTQTRWNVRIMERSRHGAGVVTYLARSLRGGPIKNARLGAWDGAEVTFT
jgi:hypothetical protein